MQEITNIATVQITTVIKNIRPEQLQLLLEKQEEAKAMLVKSVLQGTGADDVVVLDMKNFVRDE